MTIDISDYHLGRSWVGHPLEDGCPCQKAPCGLVEKSSHDCEQHGSRFSKTMRQVHLAASCPGPEKVL